MATRIVIQIHQEIDNSDSPEETGSASDLSRVFRVPSRSFTIAPRIYDFVEIQRQLSAAQLTDLVGDALDAAEALAAN